MEYILNKISRSTREKIRRTTKIDKVHKLDSYGVKAYKKNDKNFNNDIDIKKDYVITAVREANEER